MSHNCSPMTLAGLSLALFLLTACGPQNGTQLKTAETSTLPNNTQTAVLNTPVSAGVATLQNGAKLYKRCRSCHTLEQGGRHRVGPNLWGLYGSVAGTKDGFAYSKAMKNSGLVWSQENLDAYLKNPRVYLPGNRMSFAGLRKPEEREAVLTYIKANTAP